MKVRGAKGFAGVKYDTKQLGHFLLETFVGVPQMQKMDTPAKADYVKENYPKMMEWLQRNDLQPTLMNIRMNGEAIALHLKGEPAEVAFTGLIPDEQKEEKDERLTWCVVGLLFIVVILLY